MFCTCNEASTVRVVDNIKPTHLIIDEAAMTTEPEAMIPIQLADHVTLIGDHMQLQVIETSLHYMFPIITSNYKQTLEILNSSRDHSHKKYKGVIYTCKYIY